MMLDKIKNLDGLAVATAVMTVFCFVAMVLPDFICWLRSDVNNAFIPVLLLFLPIVAFGFVAGHRRNKKCRNSMFFVKVAAVSQFIISVLAILLIKLVQLQDDNDNSNWLVYLWTASTVVTMVIYIRCRKKEPDYEDELKIKDHILVILPLVLFVLLFIADVIMTAKSLHLFFNNIPQQ